MITHRMKSVLPSVVGIAALLALLAAGPAAGTTPNQLVLQSHFGREVDATTGGNVCALLSADTCQPGKESAEAGGYRAPQSVAVNHDGDVYVVDPVYHRVQELSPTGGFILMFGWNVNKTKVEAVAPQAERNVCTAVSGDVCQAGEEGTGLAEQIGFAASVAVDQTSVSGKVFLFDSEYRRVEAYTATGQFVLMIGGEVNETEDETPGATEAEKNLCTVASKDTCKAGEPAEPGTSPHGAFNPEFGGDILAAGGPQDLLYVGDEARVQEFEQDGAWTDELPLSELSETGRASAIAVDAAGDVFVGDTQASGVREFNAAKQLQPQVIAPAVGGGSAFLKGLAVNSNGQLALLIGASETVPPFNFRIIGFLYDADGKGISQFAPPGASMPGFPNDLAFAPASAPIPDEAYVAEFSTHEVEAYEPVVFAEMSTCQVQHVTATTAELCGEVNPSGLQTNAFFKYGTSSALSSQTPNVFTGSDTTVETVHAQLTGLEPNQTYVYALAAEDQVHSAPLVEHAGEQVFHTLVSPPQIVGEPAASFLTAQTAVLSSQLNPEHALTRYHFEYGACLSLEGCPDVLSTPDEESATFGAIGATREISGLAARTTYSYRLVANNEFEEAGDQLGGAASGPQGTFTTGTGTVVGAATGAASAVTTTTATISGSVNPGGKAATYFFELGVYAGVQTALGVVSSGSLAPEASSVDELASLTGLQPGLTYAYRIVIRSGYGEATGATATFTTGGISSVLIPPPSASLLAVPAIAFPAGSANPSQAKKADKPTRAQLLARAMRACAKQSKHKRAVCRRKAEQQYGPVRKRKR
jgi:hypothetical protein